MRVNVDNLESVLRARNLSLDVLAKRLDLPKDDLETELCLGNEVKPAILKRVAAELVIPEYALLVRRDLELEDPILDFRRATPRPAPLTKEAQKAILLARSVQKLAEEQGVSPATLPNIEQPTRKSVARVAREFREAIGPTVDIQKNARDAGQFYARCRVAIEKLGIFVIHSSFSEEDGSGFCLFDVNYPVIVINTYRQSKERRTFTLLHEFCHVVLGLSGISDPFVRKNDEERLCNRFAANYLIPKRYIGNIVNLNSVSESPDIDEIRRIARKLKVSQQATVIQLEHFGIFEVGTTGRWLAYVSKLGNPDFETGSGGTGELPQEINKFAKYGLRLGEVLGELSKNEKVSQIDIYRTTGLKPRFQKPYFEYAREVRAENFNNFEEIGG